MKGFLLEGKSASCEDTGMMGHQGKRLVNIVIKFFCIQYTPFTHRMHGTNGKSTYMVDIFLVNAGKLIYSYMNPMGF